jgi:predicted DsbA family dithiol-disulfide isomerase
LQMAFFTEHFTQNTPLNEHENLIRIVSDLGLDVIAAKEVLNSEAYAEQVRAEQKISIDKGINSVPTFIFNHKYSISGGQTKATFMQALKQIAQES